MIVDDRSTSLTQSAHKILYTILSCLSEKKGGGNISVHGIDDVPCVSHRARVRNWKCGAGDAPFDVFFFCLRSSMAWKEVVLCRTFYSNGVRFEIRLQSFSCCYCFFL